MAISEINRSRILQDLETHKHGYAHEYHGIKTTHEYFVQPTKPLPDAFKKNLEAISGTCICCSNIKEAILELQKIIPSTEKLYCTNPEIQALLKNHNIAFDDSNDYARSCAFSLSPCEALVARTASVIVSSAHIIGRRAIAAPETHIVFAYENQLFADLPEALTQVEESYVSGLPSQVTVITGPSRTADIEKTLVLGAHGPKKLIVVLIQKPQ